MKPVALLILGALGVGGYILLQKSGTPAAENLAQVTVQETSPAPTVPLPTPITKTTPTYHLLTTTTSTPGAELLKEVGSEHVDFTLALNRIDVKHIPKGAVLVIPDSFDDTDAYSPFPAEISAAKEIPKLFMVSKEVQAFAAYENGARVRWGTVSTGKQATPTPSRLYSTNWKGKLVTSTLEDAYQLPWYFNLDSMEGISMHQFDLPGYPASHSCIRMAEYDAQWFYDWAQQWILAPDGQTKLADGTPVIVFGEYAYGTTAPWKKLATDPQATTLSESDLNTVVSGYSAEIANRLARRAEVLGTTQ